MSGTKYQKMPQNNSTYIAYVVTCASPLTWHLHIYWPPEIEAQYMAAGASRYSYHYICEESDQVEQGNVYSCHLKNIEIPTDSPVSGHLMKETYIHVNKKIIKSNGWVLVSVYDIDIYQRILINVFDIFTRKSLNQELLETPSTLYPEYNLARAYTRFKKSTYDYDFS